MQACLAQGCFGSRIVDHERRAFDPHDAHLGAREPVGPSHPPGAVVDPDAALAVLDRRLEGEDPSDEGLAALIERCALGIGLRRRTGGETPQDDRSNGEQREEECRGLPGQAEQSRASSNPVAMAARPSQRKNEPGARSSTPIRTTPRMIQAQAPKPMNASAIMSARLHRRPWERCAQA